MGRRVVCINDFAIAASLEESIFASPLQALVRRESILGLLRHHVLDNVNHMVAVFVQLVDLLDGNGGPRLDPSLFGKMVYMGMIWTVEHSLYYDDAC